jgi:hypothetical protein
VEKPFDSQLDQVYELLRVRGQGSRTAILGLDHYQAYALPLHALRSAVVAHLGEALAQVIFYMTEDRSIELGREHSLQHGLTLDRLPHLLALLTSFGDVGTIDEIRILAAGRYTPLIAASCDGTHERDITQRFRNETASWVRFTFQDYSGNGHHVPCLAVVGKGFAQEVKYLEVIGRNGNAIRLDLNRPPNPNKHPDYPWDTLFFLHGTLAPPPAGVQVCEVQDPYDRQRTLSILHDPNEPTCFRRPLERGRYARLLDDLLHGTRAAIASTLSLSEAVGIVQALDRIWWAIQKHTPWSEYDLTFPCL